MEDVIIVLTIVQFVMMERNAFNVKMIISLSQDQLNVFHMQNLSIVQRKHIQDVQHVKKDITKMGNIVPLVHHTPNIVSYVNKMEHVFPVELSMF